MGVHSALPKAKEATSECTPKCLRDHMGVHSEKGQGPYGSAFVSDRDQMGVHSKFLIGTTSECILILIKHQECTPMWSVIQISSVHPFGPYQKRMHSDVVPLKFRSALRNGPFCLLQYTPMWSITIFKVHSALPFGPHDFQKCTSKWFSPIFYKSGPTFDVVLFRSGFVVFFELKSGSCTRQKKSEHGSDGPLHHGNNHGS